MLSGRLCRACRLRLFGSQCLAQQAQHSAQSQRPGSKHARHITMSAVAATAAERSPVVSHGSRFAQPSPPDWPISELGSPLSDFPEREGLVGEGRKSGESRRKQHALHEKSQSQDSQGLRSTQRTGRHKKQKAKGSKGSLGNLDSQSTKKKRKMIPAGARPKQPREHAIDGSVASSRNVYAIIRRRWNIPAERSPSGFEKHHERTAAYIPILSQQYKQWGYYRHQLSETELTDARRTFDRWYRRLGFILVEPHRLNDRATWRDEAAWLLEYSSAPAMCSAWTRLDVEERKLLWPGVMLSAMLTSPSRAIDVLAATMSPLPPGYAVTDVLQFVAHNLARHWPSSHRERALRADEILHLMEEVLVHTPAGHLRPTQITFGILAKLLPPSHAKQLHDMMNRAQVPIHENTALHFGSTLSQSLEHKQAALDIILESARKGTNLNEPKVTSVITSLLHCRRQVSGDDVSQDTAASFSKKALEELMEHGFIPNVINLTAFLEALCWDGELDEAIRLALLFSESGANLDGRTFSTVFKAAKESRDPEKMRKALDVAKAAKAPIVSVLNNALHSVFYISEVEGRDAQTLKREGHQAFDPMLRLYAQRFSLEPLQWLLPKTLPLLLAKQPAEDEQPTGQQQVLSVARDFFQETQVPKLQPDATTLSIMLRAYIRSLRHPYDVVSFYEFFKFKLEADEEEDINYARSLVERHHSLIHDTVILAMLDHRLSTRQLLQVLGDMLRDNLPAKATESTNNTAVEEEASKPVHPAPTLFTLSILISRLLMRKEKMVAKQLMDVMREHGIEPNLETWNAMVKGYAALQDVPQTVSMLQKLEAAGYTPDNYTFKAFGRLRNQTQALSLMDKIIRQNEAKLAQEEVY